MNAVSYLNLASTGYLLSALLALLSWRYRPLSAALAGAGAAAAGAFTAAAGALALTMSAQAALRDTLAWPRLAVQLTAVNGVWLVAFGLCALLVGMYQIAWLRRSQVKRSGPLVNLLLAAAVWAVTAQNFAVTVATAEIMALCGVCLTGNHASGKLWFALGRLGTLLLTLTGFILWYRYHTLDLMRLSAEHIALGGDIWCLGAAGFGLLAGIIPLHGWVPQAHAQADAPAAALFSGVVMKVGLFGIASLSLCGGEPPLWWGIVLLMFGMLTALIGGLYALMEHNIQRLLAYHTLENIGIIMLGLGAGICGVALHNPLLAALGLAGGLYHLINHTLFKTTLFLGAGAVWLRTGHRDIEKLGGVGKVMPLISLAMLTGLMAMAALPPLNGFASEWVIYQAFFQISQQSAWMARLLGPLLVVGLALTGALAVMCMAKVYGVTFLGAPRTPEAERARPAPRLMSLTVALAALCCVAGGVGAPWVLPLIAPYMPIAGGGSIVSPPLIALLLFAAPLLPVIIMMVFKGDRLPNRRRGSAWACGYEHEPAMVITAKGFAQPVKQAFAPLLRLRSYLNPVRLLPGWQCERTAAVFQRLAFIEMATLAVVVMSQGA